MALLGAYVVELVLRLAQVPVDLLAWWPMAFGFQPWQPLTRIAVQGGDPGVVLRVVFGLLVVWFGAPALDRRRLAQAVGAAWLGGSLLGLALDAIGALSGGPTLGWTPLLGAVLMLFGLQHPDRQVLLYFALPIPGRALVWGTGGHRAPDVPRPAQPRHRRRPRRVARRVGVVEHPRARGRPSAAPAPRCAGRAADRSSSGDPGRSQRARSVGALNAAIATGCRPRYGSTGPVRVGVATP